METFLKPDGRLRFPTPCQTFLCKYCFMLSSTHVAWDRCHTGPTFSLQGVPGEQTRVPPEVLRASASFLFYPLGKLSTIPFVTGSLIQLRWFYSNLLLYCTKCIDSMQKWKWFFFVLKCVQYLHCGNLLSKFTFIHTNIKNREATYTGFNEMCTRQYGN